MSAFQLLKGFFIPGLYHQFADSVITDFFIFRHIDHLPCSNVICNIFRMLLNKDGAQNALIPVNYCENFFPVILKCMGKQRFYGTRAAVQIQ